MKIHAEIRTPTDTYRLIETCRSSGGRKLGHFAALTTIRIPIDVLPRYETIRTKGVQVLSSVEVDKRHKGRRSDYSHELSYRLKAFPGLVAALGQGELTEVDAETAENWAPEVAELRASVMAAAMPKPSNARENFLHARF